MRVPEPMIGRADQNGDGCRACIGAYGGQKLPTTIAVRPMDIEQNKRRLRLLDGFKRTRTQSAHGSIVAFLCEERGNHVQVRRVFIDRK